MLSSLSRRKFLSGAAALGAAAAASAPAIGQGNQGLGHVVIGSGPEPVVVLHEWLGDHTNYDRSRPFLSAARAQYVLADLRGYGLSRHMTGQYTMDEAANDVVALMDRLGHARFHVVGHSMSGMIAQYLMLHWPDRIKSIVAISPVPATGFKTDAAGLAKLKAVITDDAALAKAVTARTAGRYGQPWIDWKIAAARRASPEAMEGYLAMFTGTDFAAAVLGLTTPVALITGAQDIGFYSRAALEPQFQRVFPNLQVAAINDAGHYAMLETPILLAALVERAVFAEPLNRQARAGVPGAGPFAHSSTVRGG